MKLRAPAEPPDDRVKVQPPDADVEKGPPVLFGDPDSIARRGRLKVSKRKIRFRKHGKKQGHRYHSIWIILDGKPTKLFCNTCGSGTWFTIARDTMYADVQCAIGHAMQVLNGFYLEKPFDVDREEPPARSNPPTPLGHKTKSSATLSFKNPHSREKGDTPPMATKKAPAKKGKAKTGGKKN